MYPYLQKYCSSLYVKRLSNMNILSTISSLNFFSPLYRVKSRDTPVSFFSIHFSRPHHTNCTTTSTPFVFLLSQVFHIVFFSQQYMVQLQNQSVLFSFLKLIFPSPQAICGGCAPWRTRWRPCRVWNITSVTFLDGQTVQKSLQHHLPVRQSFN